MTNPVSILTNPVSILKNYVHYTHVYMCVSLLEGLLWLFCYHDYTVITLYALPSYALIIGKKIKNRFIGNNLGEMLRHLFAHLQIPLLYKLSLA